MQTIIPPDRLQRIQDLGYDYTAQPQDLLNSCNLCGANLLVTITQRARYGYLIPRYWHWQGPPSASRLSTQ